MCAGRNRLLLVWTSIEMVFGSEVDIELVIARTENYFVLVWVTTLSWLCVGGRNYPDFREGDRNWFDFGVGDGN